MAETPDGTPKRKKRKTGPKLRDVTPEKFRDDKRLLRVEELYSQGGLTQTAIAEQLKAEGFKASQATVARDIRTLRTEWRERRIGGFSETQERALKRQDALERQAQQGWEASRKAAKTTIETEPGKTIPLADGKGGTPVSRTRTRVEKGPGDPEFLRVIQGCHQERNKILGVYAPRIREFRGDEAMAKLAALLGEQPDALPDV